MDNRRIDEPSGLLSSTQQRTACQALVYITFAFAGATLIFLFVAWTSATGIHRRQVPAPVPSTSLLMAFYLLTLVALVCSVLWARLRGGITSLPYKDFQQQTFIRLALANLGEYLGLAWVFMGGAFALSLPLFAGTAAVTLLFILPSILGRLSNIKRSAGNGS